MIRRLLFKLAYSSKILANRLGSTKGIDMHTKNVMRAALSFGSVSVILGALAVTSPAQAGFQWVAPGTADQAPVMAPMPQAVQPAPLPAPVMPKQALPPSALEPQMPMPQVIEAPAKMEPKKVAPAPAPEIVLEEQALLPSKAAEPAPLPILEPKGDLLAVPAVAPEPVKAPAETVVRGFADRVPLSVALRQVLPQEVGFSVAQDVSLGTIVSWKGGKPWREVVQAMLAPEGLAMKEDGMLVQVVRAKDMASGGISTSSYLTPPAGAQEAVPSAAPVPAMKAASPSLDEKKPVSLFDGPAAGGKESAVRAVSPAPTMGYLAPPPGSVPVAAEKLSSAPVSLIGRDTQTVDAWTANKGDTLHKVLEDWCRRANVELSWQAEYDYPLQASVSLTGSFEEVLRSLLQGFENARPQPIGHLHNNQLAGQSVLVIRTRGNNYSD